MEEVDFNVMNKEISEPTYLGVRYIILMFKHQIAPGIDGKMTEILQKVGPAWWRKIHGLIKIMWNKEEIHIDWQMGVICPIYK